MSSDECKRRTKKFAIDVIHLVDPFSSDRTTSILGKQLIRSAISIGANYRAACGVRSKAEFVSKITIVEEEADECQY
jgi:four helix bundle protein